MDSLTHTGLTAALSSAGLTAAGAETVYDTANTLNFVIDGVFGTAVTAVTDGATPDLDANTGEAFEALSEDQGSVFLWLVNAGGTVAVAQGDVKALDPDSGAFMTVPQLPAVPDGYCPFAYQLVKYTGTSTWLFGTGNWNAAGVEDAIVNIATLPHRPPNDTTA